MNLYLDLNFRQSFGPDRFFFGVANAPYLCEGGYNSPGGPQNSFGYFERSGLVPASGQTTRFWTEYEQHIALAAKLGLNAFRMGVEWARVQPGTELARGPAPEWDDTALDRYADIIATVYGNGMHPVVTLHHFTHPAWLGQDFWSRDDSVQAAVEYELRVLQELNERLLTRSHPPLDHLITFNELNLVPPKVLTGTLRHASNVDAPLDRYVGVYDNVLTAHVQVYDGIKALYRANRWGSTLIGFGSATQAPYELDKMVLDLVRVRSEALQRSEVGGYLDQSRARWNARLGGLARRQLTDEQFTAYDRELGVVRDAVDPLCLTRALDALYSSPEPAKIDYISANIYEPFRTGRSAGVAANAPRWWEFAADGDIYRTLIHAYHDGNRSLPIFMGENSIAYEQPLGQQARSRPDGWTRERYLKTYLMEMVRCMAEGVPIRGYLYWSLVDDFEWDAGFSPRLGLYNYDYVDERICGTDGLGEPAGEIFGRLIAALRSGEKSRVQAAFTQAVSTSPESRTNRQ